MVIPINGSTVAADGPETWGLGNFLSGLWIFWMWILGNLVILSWIRKGFPRSSSLMD